MKILQINNFYGEQSTGILTQHLHHYLSEQGFSSRVIYARGRTCRENGVSRLCPQWYAKANALLARFTGFPYGGCVLSTVRLLHRIRNERPDVVHLQCINGNFVNIPWLIGWLNKHKIATVVTQHAEFYYTGNCGHAYDCEKWRTGCGNCPDRYKAVKSCLFDRTAASWKKMRRAFEGFENRCVICPVSPWSERRAKESPIFSGLRICRVDNGVDTAVFCPGNRIPTAQKTVLNVTFSFSDAPQHTKGGAYLAELARRMPQVRFLVAGAVCRAENIPDNLILLGRIDSHEQLAALYRQADLTLTVSKRETYCLPCAESLCCGTPVVGFRAGGPEEISLPQFSEFVPYGDLDALEAAVRRWLDAKSSQIGPCAAKTYEIGRMLRQYKEIYGSFYEKLS